jgi:hypothetical protein
MGFSQIKSSLRSFMPRLFDDDALAVDIVWRRFLKSEFNAEKGYNEDVFEETDARAVKLDASLGFSGGASFPSNAEGSGLEYGLTRFVFRSSEVPEGANIRDQLLEGSYTYRIKKITPILDVVVQVDAEGLGGLR